MTSAQLAGLRGKNRGGRGKRRKPGEMNSTEKKYAAHLECRMRAGEILEYHFERMTFKLADDTRYTPDFMVQLLDLTTEFHEVKGGYNEKKNGVATGRRKPFIEDDAKVKIKVAAEMFPYPFCIVFPGPLGWVRKDICAANEETSQ